MKLQQEYWLDRTLYEIASAVGTPFIIDTTTHNRTFRQYV